ncbi:MAG: PD40 domain-containing protein [Bacteroidales bacterium]|nr:PD40 domain-containing protein [Bacteroidales bacterium]MBN2818459.1 PD40 domain-containing protein [Bacteroidales bacterium]
MRNLLFSLFVLGFCNIGFSQQYTPEELFEEGQYFLLREDYKEALYFFRQLTEIYPENANYNFKAGQCYLNIPGQEYLGVEYLENAVKSIVPKKEYKSRSSSEQNAPLHAQFYLGNAYRAAGNLYQALDYYNKFLDSPFFEGNYNRNVVEQEIKSCERAKIIQDAPIEMEVTALDSNINTSYSESSPVLSADGETMVFIRGLKFYDAIFIAHKTDKGWSSPENINEQIVSDGDLYPTGLNSDGTIMLLTKEINGNANIFISYFNGEKWSQAKELPGKVNTLYAETFASFGADNETIFVVSDRSSTHGGTDIYLSKLNSKNEWSKPKNLGKSINTEFDESFPILCNSGKTLFFSSKGHYNMGGFDIFYSSRNEKSWLTPRNIGYPLNTTRDDVFYMVLQDCSSGLHAIIDKVSGFSDIFEIEVKSELAIP